MNRTGTLHRAGDRSALRFERRLQHPVEKVWRAVTEPEHLAQWFPGDLQEMELAVGGRVVWSFPDEDMPEGRVTQVDPPRLLEFEQPTEGLSLPYAGGVETFRFELCPDRDGCLLVFTHTFADAPGAASFASGWQGCLDALESALEGHPVEWPDDYVDLHERYVETFGLAEGQALPAADGWTVRFERQLMHPVDKVWAELTEEGEAPAPGDAPPLRFTNGYVPAGTVTELEPPTLLEYAAGADGLPAGRVRWELAEGPGGARVVLTHSLPTDEVDRVVTALAAWHVHLELLADHLRGRTRCWPKERTEELRTHYSENF